MMIAMYHIKMKTNHNIKGELTMQKVFTQYGPGICNCCEAVVFHISIYEDGNNHPSLRATLCPECDKTDSAILLAE